MTKAPDRADPAAILGRRRVDAVNRALMDNFGLQLTPGKRKIEMLVLEKAR